MFGYGSLMNPDFPPAGLTPCQRQRLIPYWLRCSAGFVRTWTPGSPASQNASREVISTRIIVPGIYMSHLLDGCIILLYVVPGTAVGLDGN